MLDTGAGSVGCLRAARRGMPAHPGASAHHGCVLTCCRARRGGQQGKHALLAPHAVGPHAGSHVASELEATLMNSHAET